MARNKKLKNGVFRIIAIMLGVVGACWLFAGCWRELSDHIAGYDPKTNFLSYFFLKDLFPVAALFVALLFIIVSLRDLKPVVNGFALATAVVCTAAFIGYVVYLCLNMKAPSEFLTPVFAIHVGRLLMLVAYFLFAMYSRNGGSVNKVAWVVAIVALATVAAALVWGFIVKTVTAGKLANQGLILLAHVAVLYCGLRRY